MEKGKKALWGDSNLWEMGHGLTKGLGAPGRGLHREGKIETFRMKAGVKKLKTKTWNENWRMSLRRSMSKGLVLRLLARTLPPWKMKT